MLVEGFIVKRGGGRSHIWRNNLDFLVERKAFDDFLVLLVWRAEEGLNTCISRFGF